MSQSLTTRTKYRGGRRVNQKLVVLSSQSTRLDWMVLREGGLERAGHQIGGEIMPLNLALSHSSTVYLVSRQRPLPLHEVIPDIRQTCGMWLGRFHYSPIPYRIVFWKVVQACIKRGLHMNLFAFI